MFAGDDFKISAKASSTLGKPADSVRSDTALSGDEEFDDVFDGFVGAVIGGFEAAGGTVFGIGAMMEAAVGERSAQPFMEEQEEQRDLDALCGEGLCHVAGATSAKCQRLMDGQAAATAVRHVVIATPRSARCVWAETRWRWTLKVL